MIRIAARVAARITASTVDRHLDVFVRTALLEGIAGVRPHQWSSRGRSGLDAAGRHLGIDPESLWLSTTDSGMYASFVRAARSILGRSDMFDAADDLVSRVISGETMASRPGGVLYNVGQYLAEGSRWTSLPGDGFTSARNIVLRHLKQRALNDIRGKTRERTRLGPTVQEGLETDDGRITQLPATSAYSPYAEDLVLGRFLDGPWADQAREWLMDLWSRELRDSDMNVVRAWMADPGKNFTQLGRELGISGSFIGKAVVRAREVAQREVLRNPPPFLADMDLQEELSGLQMGVRRASSRVTLDQMHVSYPDPRVVRLMVYTDGYSGFFEAQAGPNQVAELVGDLRRAGLTVDPDDVEAAIEMA